MKCVYGFQGQPAGSFDGDALFSRTGEQIGFVDDGVIYGMNGDWHGSTSSGVVFNTDGEPVGFMDNCSAALPLLRPRLSALPPILRAIGPDVRGLPHRPIPSFLAEKLKASAGVFA